MRKTKTPDSALPEFMTKKQVAVFFSVSTKTVERMIHEGLPSVKLRGRRYVLKSHLADYISRNTKTA